jgi:hypothetical protein
MVAKSVGVSTPFLGSGIFLSFIATDIVFLLFCRLFPPATIGRR